VTFYVIDNGWEWEDHGYYFIETDLDRQVVDLVVDLIRESDNRPEMHVVLVAEKAWYIRKPLELRQLLRSWYLVDNEEEPRPLALKLPKGLVADVIFGEESPKDIGPHALEQWRDHMCRRFGI
jgi:hypothetical protein